MREHLQQVEHILQEEQQKLNELARKSSSEHSMKFDNEGEDENEGEVKFHTLLDYAKKIKVHLTTHLIRRLILFIIACSPS